MDLFRPIRSLHDRPVPIPLLGYTEDRLLLRLLSDLKGSKIGISIYNLIEISLHCSIFQNISHNINYLNSLFDCSHNIHPHRNNRKLRTDRGGRLLNKTHGNLTL